MPKAAPVRRGKEYLPGVQLPEPEETYRRERPGRSGGRLQAAVLGKRGRTLGKMARTMGRGIGAAHRWPYGMGREGPGGRHDGESPGRPRLPAPEEGGSVVGGLDEPPSGSG